MALIVWNTDYSVGVDALDADHIIIISLINQVDDAKLSSSNETAIGPVLRTLISYSVGHFRREEDMMRRNRYAGLARHVDEHHLLEQHLQEMYDEYAATGDPEVSKEIMELLNFWIVDHILKVDMQYKVTLHGAFGA